jgi:type II secretory pathway pseudopilin PulG
MKKAFTMMELIFIIIVIGILAAVVIPRTGSNKLHEAAIQVVSHIRYTQHLAMVDDKFDGSTNWYKARWQLLFGTSATHTNGKVAYSIFSDASTFSGNPGISELAKNPMDSSKLLTGGFAGVISYATDSRVTREMNIGEKYGIDTVTTTNCGGANRMAFDYLGRPIKGDISDDVAPYTSSGTTTSLLTTQQCTITLTDGSDNVVIAIEPETGYAHIL